MKRFVLPIIIMLTLSSPPVWAGKKPPKDFYRDLNVRFEHCKDKKLEVNLVLCFAPPDIHNAYSEFTGFYNQMPAPQRAWSYLQIQGLNKGIKQYEERVPYLKKLGVKNDAFFALYKAAAEWAEIEKQKSADELYALAYRPDTVIEDQDILYSFLRAYLSLAAKKGHAQAKQELDDIADVSWKNFLDKHSHEHPALGKYSSD
ncbi:MAG: hypothetical protein ACRBDI_03505 [Alphaproteobacteria bacterium]